MAKHLPEQAKLALPKWRVKVHPEPEAEVEAHTEQDAIQAYLELMGIRECPADAVQVKAPSQDVFARLAVEATIKSKK